MLNLRFILLRASNSQTVDKMTGVVFWKPKIELIANSWWLKAVGKTPQHDFDWLGNPNDKNEPLW